MLTVIAMTGRLLLAHWPALLAWFLGGILARYLVIELAGFVGAYSALGGTLLLPLAILARLVSFVAMFLVLRDGMNRLGAIAPLPGDAGARRRAFVDAVLGGILPFFAFYAAWGYLRDDWFAYLARALEVQQGINTVAIFAGETVSTEGTIDKLMFEPATVALIVLAFAGRWAWNRFRTRLPKWSAIGAAYLEAVWVFFTVILISEALGQVSAWVQSRQAMVWLADVRAWVTSQVEPVAWLWEAVEWLLGEAGGIILLPLAWLTIAGVIYGQAVAPQAPRLGGALVDGARRRFSSLPEAVRRRLGDVWWDFAARFRPIGRAVVLMWRAGPVLVGGYVLLYTIVLGLEQMLRIWVTRLVGPQDLYSFWAVADAVILLLVPLIVEPLRVSLVASAYDATLARLVPASAAGSSGLDEQSGESGKRVGRDELDGEGPGGVERNEERDGDREGVRPGQGA
ncbi:hypothetical protein [Agromyces albus]|uniref:Uncharacterized protein n=1 Tax=Agromyces albus TaxID=205332 RepID=A0A4Q2L9G2_9MICO|nr:hypothetical protein [Agromyces albus]RXZ73232.1 hypothetical protein ESP51_00585 [Agromyces albus]